MKYFKRSILIIFLAFIYSLSFSTVYAKEKTNDYNAVFSKAPTFTGESIVLDGKDYYDGQNSSIKNIDGCEALYTMDEGLASWKFNVKQTGWFNIEVMYFPVEGTGGTIERSILIDGKLPFNEAYGVEFSRIYKDKQAITTGKNGNDIRPDQVEAPIWTKTYIKDKMGYFNDCLYFYLEKGEHVLTFESIKEPMAIDYIKLESKEFNLKPYDEVLKMHMQNGAEVVKSVIQNGIKKYQAENSYVKSDPTLYPMNDSTSAATMPNDFIKKRLNTIGGSQWKNPRQWISWEVEVGKSGLYEIGFRSRQNFNRDLYSNRAIYVNNEIPFYEARNVSFYYSDKWKVETLGKAKNDPYLFYLKEGKNIITMEVTCGDMSQILLQAEGVLKELNAVNLQFLALMGNQPDMDRDYQIEKHMPETLKNMGMQAKIIDKIINDLILKTGQKDSKTSELEQLSILLKSMVKNPDKIAEKYTRFRDSISSFGNWIMYAREFPLQLDYLFIAEKGAVLPKAESSAWTNFLAGIVRFFASFSNDYSLLSDEDENAKNQITVWIGSGLTGGRDQALALNKLISQDFSSKTGIPVNLQLVPEGTILPATFAGKAPDVVLQVGAQNPVNYAMRKAVYDVSKFKDFNTVTERFAPETLTAFRYLDGVYAVPETMSFPIMFYRKDILEDLGIDINKINTWQDILDILPILQKQNMNFALPANASSYSILLYQNGGRYYNDDYSATALNEKKGVEAFISWMELYVDYGLVKEFSFENRFRTGEMPIGISDYTMYNLLSISAPEIRGKWAMKELPGMMDSDSKINRVSPCAGSGAIMMSASKNKDEAWEFLKWWTSADIQYNYGKELEATMGAAARYNTANIEALKKLPWAAADRKMILKQAQNLMGTPEVPGGYFTSRNLEFAMRAVFNKNKDPREALLEYVTAINNEIEAKRREFGLTK